MDDLERGPRAVAGRKEEAIKGISLPVLQVAAQRLLARSEPASGSLAHADRARDRLHRLMVALETGADLPMADLSCPVEAAGSLRLLEQLRAEVARVWLSAHSRPQPEEMLRVLRAFDRVQLQVEERLPASATSALPATPELIVELAHDFRSPLTSILFLADTLRRGQSGELNELQHHQIGILYSAALNLVTMAGDVIELAREGDPLPEKEPAPFSLSHLLESLRDLVLPVAEERGVTLRTLSPPRDRFLGYAVPLSRVLLNLITNALQATEAGFVEVVARETGAGRVEFSVRDSGRGLDAETQRHLFEPFRSRGSVSRLGFSGTGLGLTICRKLVAAMGAELRFETSPGEGTRFYFELALPPAP